MVNTEISNNKVDCKNEILKSKVLKIGLKGNMIHAANYFPRFSMFQQNKFFTNSQTVFGMQHKTLF